MDRIFMDEYYEHLRADNIEAFSKERNDEYVGRAEEYKAAKSALLEGLGLEHLFDHSHELTPKEKEIWMLFDRVDVAFLQGMLLPRVLICSALRIERLC